MELGLVRGRSMPPSPYDHGETHYLLHKCIFPEILKAETPPIDHTVISNEHHTVSRHLQAIISQGLGGRLCLGVHEDGIVDGIRMSLQQREHFFYQLARMKRAYTPKIAPHMMSLKFLPVVESDEKPELQILENYVPLPDFDEGTQAHSLFASDFSCWCTGPTYKKGKQPRYVIQIWIANWQFDEYLNRPLMDHPLSIPPPFINEEQLQFRYFNGKLYEKLEADLSISQQIDLANHVCQCRRYMRRSIVDL